MTSSTATGDIRHHAALIYVMVLVSASDREMTDDEMRLMGHIVTGLPAFRDYDRAQLARDAAACADLLSSNDGLDTALDIVAKALPPALRETAYLLACEVAAADGEASQEELRLLELIRHRLEVGRLVAAAIERATRARYMTADRA